MLDPNECIFKRLINETVDNDISIYFFYNHDKKQYMMRISTDANHVFEDTIKSVSDIEKHFNTFIETLVTRG